MVLDKAERGIACNMAKRPRSWIKRKSQANSDTGHCSRAHYNSEMYTHGKQGRELDDDKTLSSTHVEPIQETRHLRGQKINSNKKNKNKTMDKTNHRGNRFKKNREDTTRF
jgi:hypothetical protein